MNDPAPPFDCHPVETRRVVDDGRPPDPTSGLPLETDAEYAARVAEEAFRDLFSPNGPRSH